MGRNDILMKRTLQSGRILLFATNSLPEQFLLLTSRNDGTTVGSPTRIIEALVQTEVEIRVFSHDSGQFHFIFAERDVARDTPVGTRPPFAQSARCELVKERERIGGTYC
jgi:hypothetical protein